MSSKGKPCGHAQHYPSCPLCELAVVNPYYRARWEGDGTKAACVHLGKPTGETVSCPDCPAGKVRLKLSACAVHGKCVPTRKVPGVATCVKCLDHQLPQEPQPVSKRRWAYGVTTVPQRRADLLPRTLASLKAAGFGAPRLFVDGDKDVVSWEREFGLEVTVRHPNLRTACHWDLAMRELYFRDHAADRYALLQDDLICVRNLKAYLDRCPWPERGYLNLFSFRDNEDVIRGKPPGWYEASELAGGAVYHGKKQQTGRGAVALVFDRPGVMALLASPHMVDRVHDPSRGWRRVDGGIVESMNKAGYREMVSCPSLVQHTGMESTIGHRPQRLAESFPGEQFDAVNLLPMTNKR